MHVISKTPVQTMSCAICQSFEHLVEECPILPVVREMFGTSCAICQSFEHLVEECPILPTVREMFGMSCAICQSFEHLVEECPIIPVVRECLVIATPTIPIGGNIQISLGNHSHLSISNLLKHHNKPQTLNKL